MGNIDPSSQISMRQFYHTLKAHGEKSAQTGKTGVLSNIFKAVQNGFDELFVKKSLSKFTAQNYGDILLNILKTGNEADLKTYTLGMKQFVAAPKLQAAFASIKDTVTAQEMVKFRDLVKQFSVSIELLKQINISLLEKSIDTGYHQQLGPFIEAAKPNECLLLNTGETGTHFNYHLIVKTDKQDDPFHSYSLKFDDHSNFWILSRSGEIESHTDTGFVHEALTPTTDALDAKSRQPLKQGDPIEYPRELKLIDLKLKENP